MKNFIQRMVVVLPLLANIQAFSQTDTIRIAEHHLETKNLKEGLHQYLVYFENPKKQRIGGMSVWNRDVTYKKINGRDVIEVEQHWFQNDTTFNRYVYSISDRKSFAPIYHYTRMSKAIEAFNFSEKEITGADSVFGNSKSDFKISSSAPTLNWELDLEILSTLPIRKVGQRFIVNFYHPGSKTEPKHYAYEVIGSEKISGADLATLDCWKLKIDYGQDTWAIFWISKKSKEVLKMQELFRGNYRYKVRFSTPIALTKR